jgi:hypothetical protein
MARDFSRAALKPVRSKSEIRNPKPERRPKSEIREGLDPMRCCSAEAAVDSGFGLRISELTDFFILQPTGI